MDAVAVNVHDSDLSPTDSLYMSSLADTSTHAYPVTTGFCAGASSSKFVMHSLPQARLSYPTQAGGKLKRSRPYQAEALGACDTRIIVSYFTKPGTRRVSKASGEK